jgi:hypothetical protein
VVLKAQAQIKRLSVTKLERLTEERADATYLSGLIPTCKFCITHEKG